MQRCSKRAIRKIALQELQNKTIVVDTHNYLYDFIQEDNFLLPFYQMVRQFQENSITPYFVFDGQAPEEKRDTIKQRSLQKIANQQQYEYLQNTLPPSQQTTDLLQSLKPGFARLTNIHLTDSKEMLQLLDVDFHQSAGESDPVCVEIVNTNRAWACMSQDMDMFLYGCKRVLRKYDDAFYLYDFEQIIWELGMNLKDFQQLFVLLGTDYGNRVSGHNLHANQLYQIYCKYRNTQYSNSYTTPFLKWLQMNYPQYMTSTDMQRATHICSIYQSVSYVPKHRLIGDSCKNIRE